MSLRKTEYISDGQRKTQGGNSQRYNTRNIIRPEEYKSLKKKRTHIINEERYVKTVGLRTFIIPRWRMWLLAYGAIIV